MATSLNVQSAKRADARSMAAHAYRHGKSEGHVDQDRTHLNQVLHGPATFEAARAAIDALPDKQPNGRKIRTDANYTAQVVCTFPKELPEAQLEVWARETVKWAEQDAPGKLLYAVMHRDEGRPHIHMGIAALENTGKLNYRALFGRESLDDPGENLRAMQKSLAERISHLGVEATQGNDYEDTGPNAWRILKAREEGRQEKAAELQRETEKLNAEKSKNLALSGSLETARQAALTAGRAEAAQKKRADAAEEREQELIQKKEPAGPSREEIIKERDAEWNKSHKSKFKEAAQEMKGLELPATKVFETIGGYRERITDRFTSWRANVLNYVAKLKTLLERAELQVTKQAQRAQRIIEQDRSYRELTSMLTPEEKAGLDASLDRHAADKQQAREQEREQRNQAQDQGWSK